MRYRAYKFCICEPRAAHCSRSRGYLQPSTTAAISTTQDKGDYCDHIRPHVEMPPGQAEFDSGYSVRAMLVRVFLNHLWRGKKFVNTLTLARELLAQAWISKRHDKHHSPFGEAASLEL